MPITSSVLAVCCKEGSVPVQCRHFSSEMFCIFHQEVLLELPRIFYVLHCYLDTKGTCHLRVDDFVVYGEQQAV